MIPPELLAAIARAQNLLVLSHVKPDGDAVGSLLGMGTILRALGKSVTLALQDQPDADLLTIPGSEVILGPKDLDLLRGATYDTIVATDASSVDRLGALYNDHDWGAPLLVIDHHVTNTRFGAINWVEPTDAATCQMLVSLADALGVPLALPLAQQLLSGLVTDTLCFRTSNTSPAVLETGMRLMAAGGNLGVITENILDQRPFSVLRLWGLVLGDTQMADG
ncbi:MAG: DHH family phosphoesterase, partial [Caldilineaceae bacterium]